ncbi:MAG: hypothetical protein K8R23_12600 [Chthoniobacter sp.]|nr:hypothetical protein [Chthoniobacter sp.]
MKTSLILRTLLLVSALAGTAVHAADPVPATPDIQSLMAMLNRLVAEAGIEPAPTPGAKAPAGPDIDALMAVFNRLVADTGIESEPKPAAAEQPAAPAAPTEKAPAAITPADPAPTTSKPASPNLRMSSLTPSSPLGGRGATPGTRAPESDWRALFPLKSPRN